MKKMIRKISAMTVAAMLTFGMGASVYADSGSTMGANTVGAGGASVTFEDTFTISEGDHAKNLPAATFNYSIGTAGVSAMGATASSPKINVGVGEPTITNAVHSATPVDDKENTVGVTANFSGVTFTEAGIYRYAIKEELGASNVAADIEIDTANNHAGTFFLDVYVEKNATGFSPFAYVLTSTAEAPELSQAGDDSRTAAYKTKIDSITNEYTTYDLTVSKEIRGAMAANEFAFTINLTNIPEDAYIARDDSEPAAGAATGNSYSVNLGDGDSTVIYGLPSTAAYSVQEAVSKIEGYSVVVEDDNANAGEYNWIDEDNFGNSAATTIGQKDTNVDFTNTLMTISPTGVVMRFAPYMLILGAGFALVIVSRRRKAEQE